MNPYTFTYDHIEENIEFDIEELNDESYYIISFIEKLTNSNERGWFYENQKCNIETIIYEKENGDYEIYYLHRPNVNSYK